jgi:hypothetical protein
MNTTNLKKLAPELRLELLDAVGARLKYVLGTDSVELREKAAIVRELERSVKREGEAALVERVAYTWFNRLAALRFIDARGWHRFGCRVLTPASDSETQPELLKIFRSGTLPEELHPYANLQRLNDLLDGRLPPAVTGANPQAEVYRSLILAACRYYNKLMPFLFEAIDDETELLLPDDLLTATSVAEGFRTDISDDDCSEVEVLGWLYQFYISEKKDAVMARKKAVPSEDIPAVTQLFTPHWIVRYLVENSLGRLWLRSRPNSQLREHMPYYVEDPEGQAPADSLTVATPEEIKLLDPACGSGHMLTYAFDLLVKVYEEEGHAPSEIPEKILTHNLFGLEICPRAAQLASFALVCKAREQSRRAFRSPVQPQVMCLRDVVLTPDEVKGFTDATSTRFSQDELAQIHQFRENTETFGALIQPVLNSENLAALKAKIGEIDPYGDAVVETTRSMLRLVLDQAEMLSQRYQVVVANPPYMGGRYMEKSLKAWAETCYPDSKSDTYALFIQKSQMLAVKRGFFALITMQSWMFLQSFGELRQYLFSKCSLTSMFHTGPGVFPDLGAFNVLTTAFVFCNHSDGKSPKALFIKANEDPDLERKRTALSDPQSHYFVSIAELRYVPDFPLVYWLGHQALQNFSRFSLLGKVCPPRQGLATADNARFVRLWHEPSAALIEFSAKSLDDSRTCQRRWFPYNKGGNYRKWYGNNDAVVNWENDGHEIRNFRDESGKQRSAVRNDDFYFRRGIVYSLFGFENFGVRFKEEGFVFDVSGSSMFPSDDLEIVLAFLCSNVAFFYLKALAPTVNFQVGDLARLPLPKLINSDIRQEVIDLAKSSIEICRTDWDAWETSWGFTTAPIIKTQKESLRSAWEAEFAEHNRRRSQLRTNEERINELLIEEYHLTGEVSPEVVDRDLSIKTLDRAESIAAFLSYAVGCMMGRYSLDHPGLILADAGDTVENYLAKIGKALEDVQFPPDEDAIVPVLDGEWFEDDIVARFREFLRVTFGEDTLRENIQFIEDSLGKDLRKYFVSDFYKDHLSTYKKRPIYWLFQSPKKSFQALIYLHRYNRDTVNLLLNDYLREFQNKLQNRRKHLDEILASESTSARDKTAATKEQSKIDKALPELADWERDVILPLAQQRLEIDLDDGVKQNYPKFGKALAKIAGLS